MLLNGNEWQLDESDAISRLLLYHLLTRETGFQSLFSPSDFLKNRLDLRALHNPEGLTRLLKEKDSCWGPALFQKHTHRTSWDSNQSLLPQRKVVLFPDDSTDVNGWRSYSTKVSIIRVHTSRFQKGFHCCILKSRNVSHITYWHDNRHSWLNYLCPHNICGCTFFISGQWSYMDKGSC